MNRTNMILSCIFTGLLVLVLVLEKPFGLNPYEATERAVSALFPSFDADLATKIVIKKGEEETVLSKASGGQWVVENQYSYPAQVGRVKGLLRKIGEFENKYLVDDDPEDLDDPYHVGENGVEVRVQDASGNLLAGFVQGRLEGDYSDPDFQRQIRRMPAYLRKVDDREVYKVNQFAQTRTAPNHWLDTKLFGFSSTKVREINLEGDLVEGAISLKKEGAEWKLLEPEETQAKKEVANAMARSFSSASFKELVGTLDDSTEYGLEEPQLKIQMKLEDGKEYSLLIGKQLEDKSYYVTKGGEDPFVFKIYSYTIDSLKKTFEDLKYIPPPPPEENKKDEEVEEGKEEGETSQENS